MEAGLEEILKAGIQAPSGENSQPWRFEIRPGAIFLYNLPERDTSLYNWGQRGSYIAHGALLENMQIAAEHLGYRMESTFFPDSANPDLVARVTISKSEVRETPLFEAIEKRVTNRKPYIKTPLDPVHREELLRSSEGMQGASFLLMEDKSRIKSVAEAVSKNEQIIFLNRRLHNFFFAHINWTLEEDAKKSIGFFIKTLELPPPAKIGFKLFRHWGALNLLNRLGLHQAIAKQNSKLYESCSAFGAVVVPGNSPHDFVNAGRLLERVWLTATKFRLSVQPATGILFLYHRIQAADTGLFSSREQKIIQQAHENIYRSFGVEKETIAMVFRIGIGDPPSARSSRLPLQVDKG